MPATTYCRICEAACGLVAVRDADGGLVGLRPDRDHPTSRGFSCKKGTQFVEVARHPSRLLAPRRRTSTGLSQVSWGSAMGQIVATLKRLRAAYGPHAVGVYFGNPIAFNASGSVALLALLKSLGTRNVFSAGSQDCANKFAGARLVHGSALIHPIPDVERCELLVMLGSNPAVSQSSFVHLPRGFLSIVEIVERGGEVVWIDPRKTESALRCGEHLALRPGTDVYLLLAVLNELCDLYVPRREEDGLVELLAVAAGFPPAKAAEITGLDEAAIRGLARRIRERRGVAIHTSIGVNQGPFGTLSYVLAQAISYVTGNLDRAGGSLFHPLARHGADLFRALRIGESAEESRVGGFGATLDALPAGVLADEMTEEGPEKIRALVVIAGDPLRSVPGEARLQKALSSLELLVSIDLFENRTGELAHFLLPTTSWLERADFATTTATFQAGSRLQTSAAMSPRPGETRSEWRILLELAGRVTGRRALSLASRLPIDRLPVLGQGVPAPRPKPGTYLGRGPRTPDHALRFFSPALRDEAARLDEEAARLARASLLMIGRRRRIGHNGWLHGGARTSEKPEPAWMHADDLAARGVASGEEVRVATSEGEITLPVIAKDGVARGTIVVAHGLGGDANVNAIIPSGVDAIERVSGQLRMTAIAVTVTACA